MTPGRSSAAGWIRGLVPGSRHGLLAVLFVFVVLTSGCLGGFTAGEDPATGDDQPATIFEDNGTTQENATAPLDAVPASTDAIVFVDSALLTDPETRSLLNKSAEGALGETMKTPERESVLAELDATTDLDLEKLHSVTALANRSAEKDRPNSGVIIDSDWQWSDFTAAEESLDATETRRYNGVTVHVDESGEKPIWIGDFEDGTFAVGTERAVTAVIDTRAGDAAPVEGELRESYETAPDGLLKAAVSVKAVEMEPLEAFGPEDERGGEGQPELDGALVPRPEAMTFVYNSNSGALQFDTQFTMNSTDDAATVAGLVELGSSFGDADEQTDSLLDQLSVEQDGRYVTLGYETTVENIRELFNFVHGDESSGDELERIASSDR